MIVWHLDHDLWRAVHPALNVAESCRAILAAGSEINEFQILTLTVREKDIFRFHIAMDHALVLHVLQPLEELLRYLLDLSLLEVLILILQHVHLLISIETYAKEVGDDDDTILFDEGVLQLKYAVITLIIFMMGI